MQKSIVEYVIKRLAIFTACIELHAGFTASALEAKIIRSAERIAATAKTLRLRLLRYFDDPLLHLPYRTTDESS